MFALKLRAPAMPRLSPRVAAPSVSRFGLLLGVYILAHLGLRLVESGSLRFDESEQMLFSQRFAMGYNEQPPLYTWLLIGVFGVTGVGLFGIILLKLGFVAATYLCLHAIARRAMPERLRLTALGSLALLPYFGWTVLIDGAHTPMLCAVTAGTLLAVVRLSEKRTTGGYLLLGCMVGLGAMAKYSFVLFALAMVAAGLALPHYRKLLMDTRLLLSIALAAVIVLPHALWVLEHWREISQRPLGRAGFGGGQAYPARVLAGLGDLAYNVAAMAGILLTALLILSPAGFRRALATKGGTDESRFLGYWLFAIGLLLVAAVFAGITKFRTYWFAPIIMLLPIYFFSRMGEVPLNVRRLRAFNTLLLLAIVGTAAARFAGIWLGSDKAGHPASMDAVQDTLARRIDELGMAKAAFIGHDARLCANLRLRNPQAAVECVCFPAFHPAGAAKPDTLFVYHPFGDDPRPWPALWAMVGSGRPMPEAGDVEVLEVAGAKPDHPFRRVSLYRFRD